MTIGPLITMPPRPPKWDNMPFYQLPWLEVSCLGEAETRVSSVKALPLAHPDFLCLPPLFSPCYLAAQICGVWGTMVAVGMAGSGPCVTFPGACPGGYRVQRN